MYLKILFCNYTPFHPFFFPIASALTALAGLRRHDCLIGLVFPHARHVPMDPYLLCIYL